MRTRQISLECSINFSRISKADACAHGNLAEEQVLAIMHDLTRDDILLDGAAVLMLARANNHTGVVDWLCSTYRIALAAAA